MGDAFLVSPDLDASDFRFQQGDVASNQLVGPLANSDGAFRILTQGQTWNTEKTGFFLHPS